MAQTHIHITGGRGAANAACADSYTSIDIWEGDPSVDTADIVVFVDADAALKLACAAVDAYNHESGETASLQLVRPVTT